MKRALEGLAGVQKVTMRFDDGEFDVVHDPAKVTADQLIEAVKQVKGFKATVQ